MNSADTHKQIPTIIESGSDSFEILSVLGQGGMGTVYKANQKNLNRIVALKLLRLDHSADRVTLQRLQLEAKAAGQVSHPNIVKVYGLGMFKEQPFLTMEYVEGQTLAQLLEEKKTLTVPEAYNYFGQALEALNCIHSAGFVHRDIKPSNLMVTTDGVIKLMDFGIAKDLNSTTGQKMTQTSALLGSPQYMSPEQCAGQPLDVRTDIYSLGCSLYQSLAGRMPFDGENQLDVMFKHMHQQAETLGGIVDPRLSEVVAKSLTKQREDRFQTSAEFLDALNACKTGSYVPSRRKTGVKIPTIPRAKMRVVLPVAVAVLILSAAVFAAQFLQQRQPATDLEVRGDRQSSSRAREKAVADRWEIDLDAPNQPPAVSRQKYTEIAKRLEYAIARAKEERSVRYEAEAVKELAETVAKYDLPHAAKIYEQAVDLADKTYDDTTVDADGHLNTYKGAMHCYLKMGQEKEFYKHYARAAKIIKIQKSQDVTAAAPTLIAESRLVLEEYELAMSLGQFPKAEKLARQSMELTRKALVGTEGSSELALDWVKLGEALRSQLKWSDLAYEMEQAIAETEKGIDKLEITHHSLLQQCDLAQVAYYRLNNKNKCNQFFAKAMAVSKEHSEQHEPYDWRGDIALSMYNHAAQLAGFRDPKAALALARKATDYSRDKSGKIGSANGLHYLLLSTHFAHDLNDPAAVQLAEEATDVAKRLRDPRESEANVLKGATYYDSGRYDAAEQTLSDARNMLETSASPDQRQRFSAARYSALTALKLQKPQEAVTWFKQAKTILDANGAVIAPPLHAVFNNEYKQAMTRNAQ